MIVGVLFSLLASAAFSLSNLMEKRAVDRMAAISGFRTVHMLRQLSSSRIWIAGFLVGIAALALMTIAYSLAPIAIVQTILGAGLTLLVVASRLHLHEPLRRSEYFGLAIIVAAVVMVSLTFRSANAPGSNTSLTLVTTICVASLVIAGVLFSVLLHSPSGDASVSFGVASGLLYGVAALQVKGASVILQKHGIILGISRVLASPYPYFFAISSALGLLVFQTGLQRCRVALLGPITNIVASVYVVFIGMFVFTETFPNDSTLTVLRLLGFALVLAGGWVFTIGPATSLQTIVGDRSESNEIRKTDE